MKFLRFVDKHVYPVFIGTAFAVVVADLVFRHTASAGWSAGIGALAGLALMNAIQPRNRT